MIYTVQDRYEGRSSYIASATTRQMAEALAEEFEIQDREMNQYEPDRYIIKKRGLCYADASHTCGHVNNCICMLEEPYTQCPARKGNKMENKKQTVKDLCRLLQDTRAYKNIVDMQLQEVEGTDDADVLIMFESGVIQKINVSCDSCFGIIADTVNNLR